jgi:serine protease Do
MKSRLIPVILTAALTSIVTLFVAARFQPHTPFLTGKETTQLPVNYANYDNSARTATPQVDFQNAAEGSVRAVVHIKTATKSRTVVAEDPYGNDFFGELFGRRQYYIPPQMGSGSGVVIAPDGYIVTNNHVVAGADQLTVTFNDRYTAQAKVIGTDPSTDIALLKVEEKNLPYMEFGNSDDVHLGQWVLAVGYPLTLDATVTAGIVSAKSRSIGINRTQAANAIESFIQTDAAVNPGNSGGALVNTNGQLIGINSAIASPTGSYAGYSYAIPANIVRKVANDLMQYGSVQRAYLGIQYLDRRSVSPEQLASLGIDKADGVYVAEVVPNGGAAKAGIQKGDFITQINGVAVHTEPEMLEQVARYKPGDNVSINYTRSGKALNTTVELRNLKGTTSVLKNENNGGNIRLLGANFRALNDGELKKYGIGGGIAVTDIGDGIIARQTKMHNGFIITSINDQAVKTVNDMQAILGKQNASVQLAGFYPGQNAMYYYGFDMSQDGAVGDQ